jgi:hypothetical protein
MKIALACALIAFASSAAVAGDSEPSHWNPDKTAIAKLDFAFRNASEWHGSPPDIEPYNRFYAGVTIKGRRMIRAEFARLSDPIDCRGGDKDKKIPPVCLAKPRKGGIHIVPEDQFPSVKGGGCAFVDMLYDVDAERMVELMCNAPM